MCYFYQKDGQSLNIQMITNTLLLILLATSTYAQNCAPSASADQLTTGTYTINLQPYTSRLQCYNVTLDTYFTINRPQFALGLAGITNFQSDASGLDYSLRHSLPTATTLSLILIVNNGSWGTTTISYMISSRPQFTLGNSVSNGNFLASCTRQQSYPLTFNLPSSQILPTSTQQLGLLILLSGMRTSSSQFSLQFLQPVLDLNLKQINTSVITNATKQIQLIQIYYVIVELGKLTANRYNYTYSLNPAFSDFSISGIVSINTQSLQYAYFMVNKTARLSCVGFTCTACQTASSCNSQGGQVSGSQCVRCAGNQVILNGACACSSGLYLINGACQACPQGTIYNTILGSCSNLCTSNQVWLNGACQCAQGFSLVNGQCQQIRCASNLFSYLGGCYPCPSGSTASPDQSGCVCLPGYTFISATSSCILPSPSPSPSPFYYGGSNSQGSFSGNSNLGPSNFNPGGSSINSSSSGTSGIYILPNGGSNTQIPTTNPSTNNLISTPTFGCPTGAYFTNMTCRNPANLSVYQTAQLSGQNIVYVGIVATNLPNNLPSDSYSYLLVPSITNGPAGSTVSIAASTFNNNQWIANINYVSQSLPITLSISLNSTYNPYFTANEISSPLTTQIIPSQVAVYNIAITNNRKASQDVLNQGSIEDILNKK